MDLVDFYPFLFEGFPRKNCCLIVVNLLLFGWLCCWLNYLLNLFLAHKERNVIFRTIAFGYLYMRRWMDPTLHEHIYDETKADIVLKKLENIFARKTS